MKTFFCSFFDDSVGQIFDRNKDGQVSLKELKKVKSDDFLHND